MSSSGFAVVDASFVVVRLPVTIHTPRQPQVEPRRTIPWAWFAALGCCLFVLAQHPGLAPYYASVGVAAATAGEVESGVSLGQYIVATSGSNASYYQLRMRDLLKGCKDICRADMAGTPSLYFDFIKKEVDCTGLLTNAAIDAPMVSAEPPQELSSEMWDAFTYGGRVQIDRFPGGILNQRYMGKTAFAPEWTREMVEQMRGECKNGTLPGNYGLEETHNLVDALRYMDLRGSSVLVIGSEIPWVEACALAFGAAHVTTLEYGKIVSMHPQISTLTPEQMRESSDSFRGQFDAVLTFSSVEHSGLGRYGDAMNPWGDRQAVARAWCMTRHGGRIAVGIPSGSDAIIYNAHRLYGPIQLPHLLANWRVENVFQTPSTHMVVVAAKNDLD